MWNISIYYAEPFIAVSQYGKKIREAQDSQ